MQHRGAVAAAAVAMALVLVAAPAHAKGIGPQGDLALEHLAGVAPAAGSLAANVAEAAHANGLDPSAWPSAADPVAARVAVPGAGAANVSLLRPLRALALAGDARAGPEGDLTRRVLDLVREDGFGDPRQLNDDAYAVLGLRAVGLAADDARLAPMRSRLLAAQAADGGWSWSTTAPSGTDLTGLALEALLATGGIPPAVGAAAAGFLATTRADRGFAETAGGAANCESTVWGLRASDRLGEPVRDRDWWFLLGLQRPDGGFAHLPGLESDLLCTTEAATLLGEARAGRVEGPGDGGWSVPAPSAGVVVALLAATAAVAMSTRIRHP